MVHTLLVLAATCCCFCFLLFPLFFSLATTSIFYLMKNNYYFFHSPSHFLLHSFIVSVSTFAHLPFSIPYAASPYYLLPVVITPSIHRSLPPSFQQPHLHLPHHTLHYMHAHSDSYTTRTRDCEHQQYRHCRPNLLRLFSLELQRKRPPLKATSGFNWIILRLLCACEFCRGTI